MSTQTEDSSSSRSGASDPALGSQKPESSRSPAIKSRADLVRQAFGAKRPEDGRASLSEHWRTTNKKYLRRGRL